MEDPYWLSFTATRPVVTGALRYRPEAINRDIANLTRWIGRSSDESSVVRQSLLRRECVAG